MCKNWKKKKVWLRTKTLFIWWTVLKQIKTTWESFFKTFFHIQFWHLLNVIRDLGVMTVVANENTPPDHAPHVSYTQTLVLALCLMGPKSVTIRLNVTSQGIYSCHIKKNKGRGAWHLWDSWPSSEGLGDAVCCRCLRSTKNETDEQPIVKLTGRVAR